jgi:hypothetical protein
MGSPDGGGDGLAFSGFWPRHGCRVRKMTRNDAQFFIAPDIATLIPLILSRRV